MLPGLRRQIFHAQLPRLNVGLNTAVLTVRTKVSQVTSDGYPPPLQHGTCASGCHDTGITA